MEKNTDKNIILKKLIMLSKASEQKYKEGDFKGAIDDKRRAKMILNKENLEKELIETYKKEISLLYVSKFDLIRDHKVIINSSKKTEIINLLEKKSEDKYNEGDYKGAIKALRRSEKYS